MARGRHAKRSGLLSRLFRRRTARRAAADRQRDLLRSLAEELRQLRALADAQAAAVLSAEARAAAAAAAARTATEELRAEIGRLREELVWVWMHGALAPVPTQSAVGQSQGRVIDLREATRSSTVRPG